MTKPIPGARHLHTVQNGGERYAGSAILSPRQASQSQQAACSMTPCSVWTSGEPDSGARGRFLKQPQRKKKRDPVVERHLGEQWGANLYTTYIRDYICGISVHVRTDLNT